MYAFLRGIVAHKGIDTVALDVNGIGYHVLVPDSVHRRLIPGHEATLLTYCHIREDAFVIFGFLHEDEKKVFELLLGVNGIGPKVALSILSHLSVAEFGRAILDADVDAFTKVGGVGKKTAQRVVLEMKAKLGQDAELKQILGEDAAVEDPGIRDDVIDALLSLGCTPPEAKEAAARARENLGDDAKDEEVVKAALQSMAKV